jgi:uncharacterized protein (TIGR03437 family)
VRVRGLAQPADGVRTIAVPIVGAAPGIFTVTQNGTGQVAIVNQDGSLSTPTPAGTYVQVYGTGFGPYSPPGADGLKRPAGRRTCSRLT